MSMTIKQHVKHWVNSSDENMKDMRASIKSKRRSLAMFAGHQSLEKIFKAILAAYDVQIIYTHNLVKLAQSCGYALNAGQQTELATISGFYIAAKYSSVKSQFQKQCTIQFVNSWSVIIRKWQNTVKQHAEQLYKTLPDKTPASNPENIFI